MTRQWSCLVVQISLKGEWWTAHEGQFQPAVHWVRIHMNLRPQLLMYYYYYYYYYSNISGNGLPLAILTSPVQKVSPKINKIIHRYQDVLRSMRLKRYKCI